MKRSLTLVAVLILALLAGAAGYLYSKQPTRQGQVEIRGLQGSVTVRYDERGVPHIRAENEADLYRALGYVHAQDRLFQMEMLRRLSRGELAEVLGPKLLDTDKLFRSLRIRERADSYVAGLDRQSPAWKALEAYLDASTNIRTATSAPWSSMSWASTSGRSPQRTPSASPASWPTASPWPFAPNRS